MTDLERWSIADLAARRGPIEEMLAAADDIDRWCSSPEWVLSAQRAFAPEVEPLVLGNARGVALLCRTETPDGAAAIAGLEPMWGFASPIVSADPGGFVGDVLSWLDHDSTWDALLLPGLPTRAALTAHLVHGLSGAGDTRAYAGIDRAVADLADGHDTWLARRSRRFRRDRRRDLDRAAEVGLHLDVVDDDPDGFDRILAIEHRSWKGAEGSGLVGPQMQDLYRTLGDALRSRGDRRLTIARLDGHDVGYILGGMRGPIYRGLQLSYVADVAELRVGHLLQAAEIERVAGLGARVYDLGMDLEYKRRWADDVVGSIVLVHRRHGPPAAVPSS